MDKIYIPKSGVKQVDFKNGGHLLRFSVHAETLVKFLLDQIESGEFVSDKGYLSMNISERRTPSEWGDTHSASLDTWKPSPKASFTSELKVEDIPF
ncbi:hypothetical protein [uncultured Mediterranean phage uvDeep-CGR2-AD3-C76]|nr:hypothetical protein [uncultured Mediterranean phage uvDeep-CGR2-AD3-C76]|tara:strand:+ start:1454 stop:1741 length:288 start_codon:yes stop_codon:yes gene_type:complete